MASKFFFSVNSIRPQQRNKSGSLTYATVKDAPGLVNISYSNLLLKRGGSLDPIWHPNAAKIGYCTKGNLLVTLRAPDKNHLFTVSQGEIFFIPQGYIHHIENMAQGDSVVNFALNNSSPDTMQLSKAVYSISDSVFNSTFNTEKGFVDGLKKKRSDDIIKTLSLQQKAPESSDSRYKFNIEKSKKTILTEGGYLQIGTKTNLATLQGLGILGFGLNPKGIVEPHWHTNAGELVYIVRGKTRITVLSPDGNVDVMEVSAGEGAFAPASYFHNIENIGSEDVEVIAFFNNELPDYLGIAEVVGSYSNQLLASVFNTTPDYFDPLKKIESPLVIVPV